MSPNQPRQSKISTAEHGRRFRAYMDTTKDREAAEVCGMEQPAFQAWRDKVGLPAKNGRPHARRLSADTQERILRSIQDVRYALDHLERSLPGEREAVRGVLA